MRNPLSVEALHDWLAAEVAAKGADREYNYACAETCAICRYFDSLGLPYQAVGVEFWYDRSDVPHHLPAGFNAIARTPNFGGRDTFGAALERARKWLAEQ